MSKFAQRQPLKRHIFRPKFRRQRAMSYRRWMVMSQWRRAASYLTSHLDVTMSCYVTRHVITQSLAHACEIL